MSKTDYVEKFEDMTVFALSTEQEAKLPACKRAIP